MAAVPATLPAAFFHDDSGAIRFWVPIDNVSIVGATISKEALHYSFGADFSGANSLATYIANHEVIDAAVRRRVAGGSIEPVMLRERDFAVAARS